MEEHNFLYETTLDLLGGSPESSLVLRNEISLSSAEGPAVEEPKSNFLSLDLKKEDEVENSSVLVTPVAVKEKLEPSTPAPEKNLEGNWFRANSRLKSPMIRLHKEILDFCDFLSPTAEEQEFRNAAIKSVFDAIKHIWPKAKVEVFGSFKTGLYLPTSDIDVVILDSYIQRPKDGLCALSKELSQRKIAKKIQVIAKARVPIIKFVEKKSGFAFDVSFDAHNGPKAAEYIKDAVSKWPPLRPLCLILKVFLQQRELNEVYTGGIGSYALLAMLIAMLRQEGQASAEHNLGILLWRSFAPNIYGVEYDLGKNIYFIFHCILNPVKFFDMYGCKLNTVDVGVSCNGRAIFFPKSSKGFSVEGRPSLISIEDPETPDNDIGKNSFNYYQARSAFSMAFTTLTNAKAILCLDPNKSILSSIIRPDTILLERKGGNQTLNNLFPGTGEPLNQLFSEQQEMYCNFQLDNEDEELLPRGNGTAAPDNTVKSSGKKRKSPKEKNKSAKKAKGHMNNMVEKHGNGSVEPSKKKQSRRYHQNGGDSRGYSARGAGSSK